jgi:hypothetical protein
MTFELNLIKKVAASVDSSLIYLILSWGFKCNRIKTFYKLLFYVSNYICDSPIHWNKYPKKPNL